jgi:RNA polymerase sigma-70 factor (ECF subfamily)
MPSEGDVTRLLLEWSRGDRGALERLTRLVYQGLHRTAAAYLRGAAPGSTLRPTAIIGEVYVRLLEAPPATLHSRTHFYALAATCMRQILVDHARRRSSRKRGGAEIAVTLSDDMGAQASDDAATVLAVHTALEELATFDERRARVLELRYFGGMTRDEIADGLGVHPRTVANDLRFGLAWLKTRLAGTP